MKVSIGMDMSSQSVVICVGKSGTGWLQQQILLFIAQSVNVLATGIVVGSGAAPKAE